jgi:hypothetical protein
MSQKDPLSNVIALAPSIRSQFAYTEAPLTADEQTIKDLLFAQDSNDIREILDNDYRTLS